MKKENPYKFWDRVSGWSKAESAANSNLVKYINNKFGIHITPDDTVLDFGCGTGTITLLIEKNISRIYGVDVSKGMLERAQQNLKKRNIENASFSEITILKEMFQENYFQIVTSFNVLQYVKNRKKLFEQFYNLLKPQGKLIIAVPCFGDTNSVSLLLVKLLRFIRIMPETYYFSVDEIEKEMIDSGFTIVESVYLSNIPEKFFVMRKK